MEKKINIAKLLKDCPKGMELDCVMYEGVCLVEVTSNANYPIVIKTKSGFITKLTEYGQNVALEDAKCVIFPKGKTTWEGFVPPCKFKTGDVLVSETGHIILLSHIDPENIVHYHCIIPTYGSFRIEENTSIGVGRYYDCVLANEQQKQRMYDKIKCSGYKYNQSTNKLEKLIVPIFKKGDKVRVKNGVSEPRIIDDVCDTFYTLVPIGTIDFTDQDRWELAPNKFDISTLNSFDKVLVRLTKDGVWNATFFSHYDKEVKWGCYPFVTTSSKSYSMCIPYNEDTKYLTGTKNDCADFYKTWE